MNNKTKLVAVEYFFASDVRWVRLVKQCDVQDDRRGNYVESRYLPVRVWRERNNKKN